MTVFSGGNLRVSARLDDNQSFPASSPKPRWNNLMVDWLGLWIHIRYEFFHYRSPHGWMMLCLFIVLTIRILKTPIRFGLPTEWQPHA